jgi:hypothetical protein
LVGGSIPSAPIRKEEMVTLGIDDEITEDTMMARPDEVGELKEQLAVLRKRMTNRREDLARQLRETDTIIAATNAALEAITHNEMNKVAKVAEGKFHA